MIVQYESSYLQSDHTYCLNDNKAKFICSTCKVELASYTLLNLHETKCIKRDKGFSCEHCIASYSSRTHLLRHLQDKHNVLRFGKGALICPIPQCAYQQQNTYRELLDHLRNYHNVEVEYENLEFLSEEDFTLWFDLEKKQKNISFTVHRYANKKRTYFCHRSGRRAPQGAGKRLRWKPSIKTGTCCPARMFYSIIQGKINVQYFKTHIGHKNSIHALRLSAEEKSQLASQLQAGISADEILDDIRETLHEKTEMKRIHLTDKRDLRNIARDFKLGSKSSTEDETARSEKLFKGLDKYGEDSPVLFIKNQGTHYPYIGYDDFVLILMTNYQQNMVSAAPHFQICIDSTYNASRYDFELTTIVTVNEGDVSCPIATCLSTRLDEAVLTLFFKVVKEKVGAIMAKVFMSDSVPFFFSTWTDVMGAANQKIEIKKSKLEALHKKLKAQHLAGQKTLDGIISSILKYSRDCMFKAAIGASKHKPTSRMMNIRRTHIKSLAIPPSDVMQVNKQLWMVVSPHGKAVDQVFAVNDDNVCAGCHFTCPDCQACPHKTSCTCADSQMNGDVCKHAHAVLRIIALSGDRQEEEEAVANLTQSLVTSDIIVPVVSQLERVETLCDTLRSQSSTLDEATLSTIGETLETLLNSLKTTSTDTQVPE